MSLRATADRKKTVSPAANDVWPSLVIWSHRALLEQEGGPHRGITRHALMLALPVRPGWLSWRLLQRLD